MNMQGINCTKKANPGYFCNDLFFVIIWSFSYSKFYFAKVHGEYRQGNFIDVKNW